MGRSSTGDFQAVLDLVIVFEGGDVVNGNRLEYGRGEKIPASVLGDDQRDRYLDVGAIRPYDEKTPLPSSTNPDAVEGLEAATQPTGEPLALAPDETLGPDFKQASSHAEADAAAAELGVTFPAKTKLDAKNEALAQVYAARATGGMVDEGTAGAAATSEDLAELSDDELIQRGVDYGHVEDEMAEMSHDELVLFVAEAMARQGSTTAAQEASVAERDANELQSPAPPTE